MNKRLSYWVGLFAIGGIFFVSLFLIFPLPLSAGLEPVNSSTLVVSGGVLAAIAYLAFTYAKAEFSWKVIVVGLISIGLIFLGMEFNKIVGGGQIGENLIKWLFIFAWIGVGSWPQIKNKILHPKRRI